MNILGYTLEMTCEACPEQYDVYDYTNQLVGYLRLKHGSFRANWPHSGGKCVYEANPRGDGIFESEEREFYLDKL